MTSIEREIQRKIDDVTARMLLGAAKDYPAYASLVARYLVLRELVDFIKENPQGDELVHDEK